MMSKRKKEEEEEVKDRDRIRARRFLIHQCRCLMEADIQPPYPTYLHPSHCCVCGSAFLHTVERPMHIFQYEDGRWSADVQSPYEMSLRTTSITPLVHIRATYRNVCIECRDDLRDIVSFFGTSGLMKKDSVTSTDSEADGLFDQQVIRGRQIDRDQTVILNSWLTRREWYNVWLQAIPRQTYHMLTGEVCRIVIEYVLSPWDDQLIHDFVRTGHGNAFVPLSLSSLQLSISPVTTFEAHKSMSSGHASKQGQRMTMEDQVILHDSIMVKGRASPLSFHAVLDGHGGTGAVTFAQSHLVPSFVGALEKAQEIPTALSTAFVKTHADFMKAFPDDTSGTTVTAVVIDSQIRRFWCANAGDSRAILSRKGQAIALSVDHKPNREDEKKRIQKADGLVIYGRVQGQLAVSRAIGDKEFQGTTEDKRWVIPDPEIISGTLMDDDSWIVIACDGLYDVMSNQEILDYLSTITSSDLDQ
jgi:serine/threonine protein phosphatase PrpC